MIEYRDGDLLRAEVEALVNPVNCAGVMGASLARQFREQYPKNFAAHHVACLCDEVRPGRMFMFATGTYPKWIINFPTKWHWRNVSRLADIDNGLIALVEEIKKHDIRSIAVPALGCGLGGLAWDTVRPRIHEALESVDGLRTLIFRAKND